MVLSSNEEGYTNRQADMKTIFSHKVDVKQPEATATNEGPVSTTMDRPEEQQPTRSPRSITTSSPRKESRRGTASTKVDRRLAARLAKQSKLHQITDVQESGQVSLEQNGQVQSGADATKKAAARKEPSSRAMRNSAFGNYDRLRQNNKDAALPDLLPVAKVTDVKIQNKL